MKKKRIMALLLTGFMTVSMFAGFAGFPVSAAQADESALKQTEAESQDLLMIARQGMFSSGGSVTAPVEGTYDSTMNWLDATRAGNTAHVDHANVFYQIPVNDNSNPIVYFPSAG